MVAAAAVSSEVATAAVAVGGAGTVGSCRLPAGAAWPSLGDLRLVPDAVLGVLAMLCQSY